MTQNPRSEGSMPYQPSASQTQGPMAANIPTNTQPIHVQDDNSILRSMQDHTSQLLTHMRRHPVPRRQPNSRPLQTSAVIPMASQGMSAAHTPQHTRYEQPHYQPPLYQQPAQPLQQPHAPQHLLTAQSAYAPATPQIQPQSQPTQAQPQLSAPKVNLNNEPQSPEQINVNPPALDGKEKEQDSSESVPPVTKPTQSVSTETETIEFDASAPMTELIFKANARKYTTRSLQHGLVVTQTERAKSLDQVAKMAFQQHKSSKEKENFDLWKAQANKYKAKACSIEKELRVRGAAIDLNIEQQPIPDWPIVSTEYIRAPLVKHIEYDEITDNFPRPSTHPGRVDPKDPLVNSYRPTVSQLYPATRDQRQLGEIIMAEYPYWCSKCKRFGHKSDWCHLWTAKAFLWYFALIQDRDLKEADYCARCSKSNPEAAKWHTTKNCGLLVPYDHPENNSLADLELSPELQRTFARPCPSAKGPSPLPRCLIFKQEDAGYAPETQFRPEDPKWKFNLLGYERMLAGLISTRRGKNKNDSIPEINKLTKKVWCRLLLKDCPMITGARSTGSTPTQDSGWGNIPDNDRAPCTVPDYKPGAQGWWSAEFLDEVLPLLTAEELKNYDYQKSNWKLASEKAKKLQGDDQKKTQISGMIRIRRHTWDNIFWSICHKAEFARRVKALKEAEENVQYEAKLDPIKCADFEVFDKDTLSRIHKTRFRDWAEELDFARPLQMKHDVANAIDCQPRIDYIKRQVGFFWGDKVLKRFLSWIESETQFIEGTNRDHAERSDEPKIVATLRKFNTNLASATREYAMAMQTVAKGSDNASEAAHLQYKAMLTNAKAAETNYNTKADAIMQALHNKHTAKVFRVLTVKNVSSLLFVQGGCRLAKLPIAIDPQLLFPPKTFCEEAQIDGKCILEGLTPAWVAIPPKVLMEESKNVK